MRIAHISDVHIRLKDRHDEYSEVFDRLYKVLRASPPDRILLTGDIVHSKITLSPELVAFARDFLSKLALIAPVDLIAGNHDMNLSNMDRLDALSPIVDTVKNVGHGLTYYKETGIHKICGGFSYGVYSLLDGGDIRFRKKDREPGHTYIALYHGVISGCKMDNGYVFSDSSTSMATFENFDFVMAGDIHKRQFLNERKTAAYPGSLIQQNHGEELGKGFLMWDIRSADDFDVEFVEIPNDYAYYTILANSEDGLPDLTLPSKTRIRVVWAMRAQDMSRSLATVLNSEIKAKYNPLSVQLTFKPIGEKGIGSIVIDKSKNLADPTVQSDLLRQWFQNLDEEVDIDQLMAIDKQVLDTVMPSEFEDFSHTHWHIKKITMDNFMSYGDPVEIDFDIMRGTVGLFGNNTAGKSVIIDAVLYALFNKTTREVKNEDLVNKCTDSEVCNVKLQLDLNGVEYEIDRTTTRQFQKKTGAFLNARTDVTLKRRYGADDDWEDLTETERKDTEKVIRNAVGSYEDFLITALSTQGGFSEFLRLGPSARSDVMLRFLGLDIFAKKYDYAKDLLKQVDNERKGLDRGNEIELLDTKRAQVEVQQGNEARLNDIISAADVEIERVKSDISKLTGMINTTIKIDKDGDQLRDELETIKLDITKTESDKVALTEKIGALVEGMKEIEALMLSEDELLKLEVLRTTADMNKREISECKRDAESNRRVLMAYQGDLDNENKCPVSDDSRHSSCVYLTGFVTKQNKASELTKAIKTIVAREAKLEKELAKLTYVYDIIAEQEQIREHMTKAVGKLATLRREMGDLDTRLEIRQISMNLINSQLKIADNNEETIRNNKAHKQEIALLSGSLAGLQKKRAEFSEGREAATGKLILLRKEISDIEEALAKIRESDIRHNLYNTYCNAMNRKGLPVDVLRGYIPKINYEVNKILSDVVNFGVYLKIESGETDIDIVMRYDGDLDDTRPASMASGMEKLLINMAIRYALLKVSNLNTPSTWFIDEGFGVLDAEHLGTMAQFFNNVRGTFRSIVIITHIDMLKDVANWVINIEKKGGISLPNPPVKNI